MEPIDCTEHLNLTQYISDATRSESPWNNFFSAVMPDGTPSKDFARLSHAIHGFVTEAGELLEWSQNATYDNYDRVNLTNLIEELGDWCWYFAIYMDVCEKSEIYSYRSELSTRECIIQLNINSAQMANIGKRTWFYGKEFDFGAMETLVVEAFSLVRNIMANHNMDIQDVLTRNINKLKARYPDKFSTENAINRDLDAEAEALTN